jgi:hypothetical protein
MRGAFNSTTYQNFTVTVLPLGAQPPTPSGGDTVWASFKYVVVGMTVSFSDNSYGQAVGCIWDFGDGKGSTRQNPDHLYARPGTYNVTLTVLGADNKSYVVSTRISVGQNMPLTENKQGWSIAITKDLILRVSAIGTLILGFVLCISVSIVKDVPIITRRGRMTLGVVLVLVSLYFFLFVSNQWLGG